MNSTEQRLIQIIKEEYIQRLDDLFYESVSKLKETDMFDSQGNQLLSPGLKVRHKKSGFEYTVDHVEGVDDDAIVFLRHPEEPRFKAPDSSDQLTEGDDESPRVNVGDVDLQKVMGGEPVPERKKDQATVPEVSPASSTKILKVAKKEFEKDYEVK